MKKRSTPDESYTGANPFKATDPPPLTYGWFVPDNIRLEGSRLLWSFEPKKVHQINPNRTSLRDDFLIGFSRLGDASDGGILEYARQWGILGICKHGRPVGHLSTLLQYINTTREICCEPPKQGRWSYDPLEKWRDYAEQVQAVLRLARQCWDEKLAPIDWTKTQHSTVDKPGSKADWEKAIREWRIDNPDINGSAQWAHAGVEKVRAGRSVLSMIINQWLKVNNIRPQFGWYENQPSIALAAPTAYNTLLPMLAVQMMLEVSNSIDLALCSGCSKPFHLRRGQSLHRKSYCLECKNKRIPQREAVKNYYHMERKSPDRKKRIALTEKQVAAIKRALKKGERGSAEALSKRYGVSKWTIYKIGQGKNWANVK
jgi:hypothetical protein